MKLIKYYLAVLVPFLIVYGTIIFIAGRQISRDFFNTEEPIESRGEMIIYSESTPSLTIWDEAAVDYTITDWFVNTYPLNVRIEHPNAIECAVIDGKFYWCIQVEHVGLPKLLLYYNLNDMGVMRDYDFEIDSFDLRGLIEQLQHSW